MFTIPENWIIVNPRIVFVFIITPLVTLGAVTIITPFITVSSQGRIVVWEGLKRSASFWLNSRIFNKITQNAFSFWISFRHDVKNPSCGLLVTKVSNLCEVNEFFKLEYGRDVHSNDPAAVVANHSVVFRFDYWCEQREVCNYSLCDQCPTTCQKDIRARLCKKNMVVSFVVFLLAFHYRIYFKS